MIKGTNVTAITTISDNGLVHNKLIDGWLTSDIMCDYLDELKAKYPNEKVAIFFDNCPVHHAKAVKAKFIQLEFVPIYNIAY